MWRSGRFPSVFVCCLALAIIEGIPSFANNEESVACKVSYTPSPTTGTAGQTMLQLRYESIIANHRVQPWTTEALLSRSKDHDGFELSLPTILDATEKYLDQLELQLPSQLGIDRDNEMLFSLRSACLAQSYDLSGEVAFSQDKDTEVADVPKSVSQLNFMEAAQAFSEAHGNAERVMSRLERSFDSSFQEDFDFDNQKCDYLPLHGDLFQLSIASQLLQRSTHFFEMGTFQGGTLCWAMDHFKNLQCIYSVEPVIQHANAAVKYCKRTSASVFLTDSISNTGIPTIFLGKSEDLIPVMPAVCPDLESRKGSSFVFVDSHSYGFDLPLQGELKNLTTLLRDGVIWIDDFNIDSVKGKGLQWVQSSVKSHVKDGDFDFDPKANLALLLDTVGAVSTQKKQQWCMLIPNYRYKTSPCHGLVGWAALGVGADVCNFMDDSIASKASWMNVRLAHFKGGI